MRTALGIPSPSCQVGNTEQSNTIRAGNLFLALRDRGVGVCVWEGCAWVRAHRYACWSRGGCLNSPDHEVSGTGLWQPRGHGIHAGGATWDEKGILGLAWAWAVGQRARVKIDLTVRNHRLGQPSGGRLMGSFNWKLCLPLTLSPPKKLQAKVDCL